MQNSDRESTATHPRALELAKRMELKAQFQASSDLFRRSVVKGGQPMSSDIKSTHPRVHLEWLNEIELAKRMELKAQFQASSDVFRRSVVKGGQPMSCDIKSTHPQVRLSEAELEMRMELKAQFQSSSNIFRRSVVKGGYSLEMSSQLLPEVKKTAFEYNPNAEVLMSSGDVPVRFQELLTRK
jgi:hypothetical protein